MSTPHSDADLPEEPSGFRSTNCEIVIIDGPSEKIDNPLPPHVLKILIIERERLLRYQELAKNKMAAETQPPDSEKPI